MKTNIAILLALAPLTISPLLATPTNSSGDPGWPREHFRDGNKLIVYQPQVDAWTNFHDLSWRMAVALTPKGSKEIIGVVEMKGVTNVDNDNKLVYISNVEITGTHFPPDSTEKADQLMKTFAPKDVTISLHRLIASVPKPDSASGVELNNEPPKIFVGYRPSILLNVNGEPHLTEVPNTNLKFVLNTQWPLFFDGNSYYLVVGEGWLTSSNLEGPWTPAKQLPADMSKVAADKQWAALKKIIPVKKLPGEPPAVFYSDKQSDIILFDGQPVYAKIPDTQLSYATNTNSVVFLFTPTQQFYYLVAGRWFSATDLQGAWTYATPNLPDDFKKIPASCPASAILASVPGTDAAKDAVLLAQVPTSMTVNATDAASKVKVEYGGDPHFEPIKGTSMAYATNTQDKVIKVGDVYYLCLNAVWFMSANAQGPWTTAQSVPQEIYTIPSSSPVYNVTYVTQTSNPDGTVQSSYTAGYVGAFILGAAAGAIIANGSGYWGAPYYGTSVTYKNVYNYPGYYPYPSAYGGAYGTAHYNSATGAYGYSQTASGPYGTATRGAAYNPYTGTAARGATVSTPYGSRSAAQAYNPYTGTYAQTKQGSSPTAQWGSSYVSNGNKSATAGHYSTANGTVAGVSGSQGGKAAASNTAWGSSAAVQTKNGDMYASHDGNVYKNTGSGWESANGNSANKSSSSPNWSGSENSQQKAGSQSAQQRSSAQSSQARSSAESSARGGGSANSEMDRQAQNRSRGNQESQRFSQERGGGGGGGGRFGGGGGGGGGGSRGGGGRRR